MIPNFVWTLQAILGKILSGVVVATIIRSISLELMPALFIAFLAASKAKSLVSSSGPTICLSFIPVLKVIHSSVVSKLFSRSLFVQLLF